jgi:hypothetical protein
LDHAQRHNITMFLKKTGLHYAKAQPINTEPTMIEEGKKVLFGQTAR